MCSINNTRELAKFSSSLFPDLCLIHFVWWKWLFDFTSFTACATVNYAADAVKEIVSRKFHPCIFFAKKFLANWKTQSQCLLNVVVSVLSADDKTYNSCQVKQKQKQKPNQQTNKHGGAVCWVNQTGMSLMCPFLFICVLLICVCGICISEGCALASFRCRRVFGECGKFSCVLPPALWLCHRHLHQCSSSCAFHGVIVDDFTAVIFSIMRQPRQTACEDLITRLFSSGVIKGSSNVFGWL